MPEWQRDKKKPMKLKSMQLLVSEEGGIIMGKGRMDILDSIDRTGSINKTAKEMNMSYKSVWSKIKSTEENFGKPVVLADRVKGSCLTAEGRRLLERYRVLNQRCMAADDAIFDDIFMQ